MTETGEMTDLTGAHNVEVRIRADGKVMWINIDDVCRLRICQIDGAVIVHDERDDKERST